MSIMELDFPEIMRTFLTMSLTGSVVALLLFMLKPIVKDRLPKSFQYYMWFAVYIALILPLSSIVAMPKSSVSNSQTTSFTPIYDIVQWISHTALEEPVPFPALPQGEREQSGPQAQGRFLNVAAIFFIVRQFGILVFLGSDIICYRLFVRKLKKWNVRASPREIGLLNQLSGRECLISLYRNPVVPAPVLIGMFRPMIILPDKRYEDKQLQNILLHELTHLRRHDIAIKGMSAFLGALHWYNPMIYFVRREISRACELACDEAVIKNFDTEGKRSYGDTLIAVAADRTVKITLSATMCEDKKILKERLDAIMKHRFFSGKTIVLASAFLITVLCGMFYFCAAGSGNNAGNGAFVTTYADSASPDHQRNKKESGLVRSLYDFDKNIVYASAFLKDSDNESMCASIFIVSQEEITDSAKKDEIMQLVSESLNLDENNICIDYMDVETFTSL